jgi:hypothetical protein
MSHRQTRACSDNARSCRSSDTPNASESAGDTDGPQTDGSEADSDDAPDSGAGSSSGGATTGTGAGETGDGSTTSDGSAESCDLVEWVSDAVSDGAASAEDVVDCGIIDTDDDVASWVAMRDCVLTAANAHQPYMGFVHRDNGMFEAFGAVGGESYSPRHWIGPGTIFMERCSEPEALPDCEPSPAVGTCLSCFGEGDQVCP